VKKSALDDFVFAWRQIRFVYQPSSQALKLLAFCVFRWIARSQSLHCVTVNHSQLIVWDLGNFDLHFVLCKKLRGISKLQRKQILNRTSRYLYELRFYFRRIPFRILPWHWAATHVKPLEYGLIADSNLLG
jgi:hypothetical protein